MNRSGSWTLLPLYGVKSTLSRSNSKCSVFRCCAARKASSRPFCALCSCSLLVLLVHLLQIAQRQLGERRPAANDRRHVRHRRQHRQLRKVPRGVDVEREAPERVLFDERVVLALEQLREEREEPQALPAVVDEHRVIADEHLEALEDVVPVLGLQRLLPPTERRLVLHVERLELGHAGLHDLEQHGRVVRVAPELGQHQQRVERARAGLLGGA